MMATKKLGVELTAKDKISRVTKKVADSVKAGSTAWKDWGDKGRQAIETISHVLTGLQAGIGLVSNAIRGFWNTFIKPAEQARKITASLANVFGGGTAEKIRKFSLDTGLSFEAVSKAALDMSDTLGQVGGLDNYLKAIERVSNWRPDLGAEGAIAKVNSIIGSLKQTAGAGSKQLGQFTSVVTGGVGQQAMDLSKELDKLGVVAKTVDPAVSALDRLREAWKKFAAETGEKILGKIVDAATELLDWLSKNEDKVIALTERFADWINQGLQLLIDWLSGDGPDKLVETFHKVADAIEGFAGSPFMTAVGEILSPGKRYREAVSEGKIEAPKGGGIFAKLFGQTGETAAGIPRGASRRQQVDVKVGIDPKNGSVQPYLNRQNEETAKAMSPGMIPQYGR